jgi:hypothetical protein
MIGADVADHDDDEEEEEENEDSAPTVGRPLVLLDGVDHANRVSSANSSG